MKKFALIAGGKVQNIVAAESQANLGPAAASFISIDITDLDPAPSLNWGWSRTEGFTMSVDDNFKGLLTGDTLTLEFPTAAAKVSTASSSKKKSSSEDLPAEE